jgi:hypothetical protein
MENCTKISNLHPNALSESEKHLIAPCGIYCGACDLFLGNSRNLAKEMYRILNGFNMADVGPRAMGIRREKIVDFLNILQNWSLGSKCPGCWARHWESGACPIRACSQHQAFLTCAECDRMPCNTSEQPPSSRAAAFLGLVTRRYSNWNIANLEQIREVGYRRFVDEMQERVRNGFLTSDVISGEMVISAAAEKMKRKTSKRGGRQKRNL